MMSTVAVVLVCLLVVEVIFRIFFPRPRLRREPQVRIDLDERMGYRTRPDQRAFTVEAPVTINSLGIRGGEIELERQPGSVRILGLGNSLTFGSGVRDDETYLAYANEKLSARFPDLKIEVLNSAIIGFTIRQYVPFLESILPKIKPDIVLLGAHWRDLHFNPRFGQLKKNVDGETWHLIKKKFMEQIAGDPPVTLKEKFMRQLKNFVRRWRTLFVTIYYLQVLRDKLKTPSFAAWQKAFLSGEETEAIQQRRVETHKTLSKMKKVCQRLHIKLIIVVFPDFKQLTNQFPHSTWPSLLTNVCDDLNIDYFQLLPAVQAAYKKFGSRILMPYDPIGHYNIAGHKAIGEALADYLGEQNLFRKPASRKPTATVA